MSSPSPVQVMRVTSHQSRNGNKTPNHHHLFATSASLLLYQGGFSPKKLKSQVSLQDLCLLICIQGKLLHQKMDGRQVSSPDYIVHFNLAFMTKTDGIKNYIVCAVILTEAANRTVQQYKEQECQTVLDLKLIKVNLKFKMSYYVQQGFCSFGIAMCKKAF